MLLDGGRPLALASWCVGGMLGSFRAMMRPRASCLPRWPQVWGVFGVNRGAPLRPWVLFGGEAGGCPHHLPPGCCRMAARAGVSTPVLGTEPGPGGLSPSWAALCPSWVALCPPEPGVAVSGPSEEVRG